MKHTVKVGSEFQMAVHVISDFEASAAHFDVQYNSEFVQFLEAIPSQGHALFDIEHSGDAGPIRRESIGVDGFDAGEHDRHIIVRFRALQPCDDTRIALVSADFDWPESIGEPEKTIVNDTIAVDNSDTEPKPKGTVEFRFEFVKQE